MLEETKNPAHHKERHQESDHPHEHDQAQDHGHDHTQGHELDHDHHHGQPQPHDHDPISGDGHRPVGDLMQDHNDPHGHQDDHWQDHDASHTHDHGDGHHHDYLEGHTHDHLDGHSHDHEHGHGHSHTLGDDHSHDHGPGIIGWFQTIFHWHGHSQQQGGLATDQALLDNKLGVRVLWLSLGALLLTSVLQVVIVWFSGSVALLADTLHNIGDGLNSIPLLIALYLARKVATRRYTYGFGKAEDVAGIFIVLSIAVSAFIVFSESIQKFISQEPMTNLGWVSVAAIIGFLGNELVAVLEIRTGRKIGSAAMVTDGLHARTDGLTSLSVLLAAIGTRLGFPIIDPIIGMLIGVAILFITRDAIAAMWYRLMDAIEPEYMDRAEAMINGHAGIKELRRLRMRWVGHRLHAEIIIAVDPELTTAQSHDIAEDIRHEMFHAFPTLSDVMIHVDPWAEEEEDYHSRTKSHDPIPEPLTG